MHAPANGRFSNQAKNELRPFIPLLIGQGKLARHLVYYLTSKSIPFQHWPESRKLNHPDFKKLFPKWHAPSLKGSPTQMSVAWILVSDRAIAEVCAQIRKLDTDITLLHSSAATSVPGVLTLHPLQTFGPELYSERAYEEIPFMLIEEEWQSDLPLKISLKETFPNPVFEISNANRALYHAYCVMMANFPQLLWSQVEKESASTLPNPSKLFAPILKQTAANFLHFGKDAVTGPIVRNDVATLALHEKALAHSALLPLYQNFVKLFSTEPFSRKTFQEKEIP
jgi:predicted short-subunit dehydrogenase-like oxidoreductase (DUF2520 family)